MLPFTLDTSLNFLWLGIVASALLALARIDWMASHRLRWRRLFAVLLATIALFPIVSDSDDLFNFSRLPVPGHTQGAGTTPEDDREKDSVHLARLLEALDHFQVAPFYQIALSLCFVALLLTVRVVILSRPVFAHAGRAPPLA